jgi:hypothetical protein
MKRRQLACGPILRRQLDSIPLLPLPRGRPCNGNNDPPGLPGRRVGGSAGRFFQIKDFLSPSTVSDIVNEGLVHRLAKARKSMDLDQRRCPGVRN